MTQLANLLSGIMSVSPWVLGGIAVVAFIIAIALIAGKHQIVYVDPDGDYEIYYEVYRSGSKVQLHGASKAGKKLVGWSTKPDGSALVTKTSIRLFKTTELYAVWEDVEEEGAVRIEINYMDADDEVAIKKETIVLNAKLPDEQDEKLTVAGWGFDKDGDAVLSKDLVDATFVLKLYPVFEEGPVDYADEKTNDKVVIDILYTVADKNVYKESHYVSLALPQVYEQYANFVGWGFDPEGELILDKTGADSIFTIQLTALGVEACEEPAAEEVVEEVVEEPVVEETVEETVEEVVEEPAAEEAPAEEEFVEVIEEPVAEEEPVVEEAVEEVAEEPVAEEPVVEEPVVYEEVAPTVVPTYIDNEGNKIDIKYSRSFEANVIQSDDTVKDYYSELKNHILSYKGVKTKISWKFDSFGRGRDQLFKMKLRGKTICLYCALNPDDFDKSKYHHEAIDAKIFAEVPMLVKIKSGLGLRKAKELVDIVMANYGIEKNPKFVPVDYVAKYPYEETEALLAKKLVKALVSDDENVKVSQKPVEEATEEPVIEEIVEEPVVEEVVEEVAEEPVVEEAIEEPAIEEAIEEPAIEEVVEEPVYEEVAPTVVPVYIDNEGNKIDIKYSRSFEANVIQSEDAVKDYYSELKNHILSYKGVKSRLSWKFDSYGKGRTQLFKMKLRGKTICLYCALNPDDFDKSKYHHQAVNTKMFAEVPMLVKVKSGLALRKAKELVDIVMANFGIEKNPKFVAVDYVANYPYEETEALVAKKLVKVLVSDDENVKVSQKPVEEAVEEPVVEEAVEEPVVEEVVEEPVIEEVVEEPVVEEAVEEPVIEEVVEEPVVEEAIEEPVVEEAIEEPVVEEAIEEPVVEEVVEEPVVEEPVVLEEVSAYEADEIAEEKHVEVHVEEDVEYISAKDAKKAIINIDTISDAYEAGEVVDLASLKEKGLIDKRAKSLKILARGSINKPLTIKAGEFSNTAVKMIVLTGGTAVHVSYKVK